MAHTEHILRIDTDTGVIGFKSSRGRITMYDMGRDGESMELALKELSHHIKMQIKLQYGHDKEQKKIDELNQLTEEN